MSIISVQLIEGGRMFSNSCPGTTQESATETSIMTPNYPNNYPNSKDCEWKLWVPQGRYIKMDIEWKYLGIKCYDYLEIIDRFAPSSLQQYQKFCHQKKPPPVIFSYGNSVDVKFHSSPKNAYKGFKITYMSVKPGIIKLLFVVVIVIMLVIVNPYSIIRHKI